MSSPLIIKDFDQGIGDSPHKGFGLMRCVDIESFPGAVKVKNIMTTLFHTAYASTFTAVAATDVCTSSSTVPQTGTVAHSLIFPAASTTAQSFTTFSVIGNAVNFDFSSTVSVTGSAFLFLMV